MAYDIVTFIHPSLGELSRKFESPANLIEIEDFKRALRSYEYPYVHKFVASAFWTLIGEESTSTLERYAPAHRADELKQIS